MLWAWVRLPAWLGRAFTYVITRFALHGHPLRTRTLAVAPYLERWPWRLHLRVYATGFGFAVLLAMGLLAPACGFFSAGPAVGGGLRSTTYRHRFHRALAAVSAPLPWLLHARSRCACVRMRMDGCRDVSLLGCEPSWM